MAAKNREARDKMVRARTGLLISNGFFGFLSMQLQLIEMPEIETAGVDGKSLFYNPDFVMQLDDRECEFLWAHEVMHCAFQHMSRRGSRQPTPWNIAGDFVINLDLEESGFKLINNRIINGKNFQCCIDKKYKGMTTEEVYETFPTININVQWDIGGVMDAPGTAGEKEGASQGWEILVRSAVQVAKADGVGKIPGSLRHLIENLDKPKVSWRERTRNFIDQSLAKDVSWSRLSRRSASIGVLLPGLISDRLNHLIMIIDTSGSIGTALARSFLSEVAGALDEGTTDRLTVIYADTKVQHVDTYVPGDIVSAGIYTGGGTAFSESFKWIAENAPDASCVIYLTDLEVYDFGEDPGCPVLWAVYATDSHYPHLAEKAPFGTCIQVSNQYG